MVSRGSMGVVVLGRKWDLEITFGVGVVPLHHTSKGRRKLAFSRLCPLVLSICSGIGGEKG